MLQMKTALEVYLDKVHKYPLLSPTEEANLTTYYYKTREPAAAQALTTANLRLVVKIARDLYRGRNDLLDLIQEGNSGLMRAIELYDPNRGVKLSSYSAWWIKSKILTFLMHNKSQIKIATSNDRRKLFYNLSKETERLSKIYERVTPELIAESLKVSKEDVVAIQKRLHGVDSLVDAEVMTKEAPLEEKVAKSQVLDIFAEQLDTFSSTLKERDLLVLKQRILSDSPKTLKDLSNIMEISRERVRQLEVKVIKNLKKFIEKDGRLVG